MVIPAIRVVIAVGAYYLNDYVIEISNQTSNLVEFDLSIIGGPNSVSINVASVLWSAVEPLVTFIINALYENLVYFLINRLEFHQ